MLEEMGVPISDDQDPRSRDYFLTIGIDRSKYKPCIVTSYSIGGESSHNHAKSHPLSMDKHVDSTTFSSIAGELKCKRESYDSLTKILSSMMSIFFDKEAFSLSVRISRDTQGQLAVARSSFAFDDAAFRSGKRHGDIHEMRDLKEEVPEEVEAEKDGIVYIKYANCDFFSTCVSKADTVCRLKGEGNIGTLGKQKPHKVSSNPLLNTNHPQSTAPA